MTLTKPTAHKRDPIMDFNEMIDYVEQKHSIRVCDYLGLFGTKDKESHFDEYCRVTGDAQPNDGFYPDCSLPKGKFLTGGLTVVRNGVRRAASQEEHDADFKLIHEQYCRYQKWSKTNPEPEYLNYWHWLIENHFYNVHNPCEERWCLKDILDDEDTPDWVKEITQLVYDAFVDDLEEDGGIEVDISW